MLRQVFLVRIVGLLVPLRLAAGRGLLRTRGRRLGGRAVGGRGAGKLKRISQSDEVDVQSAQYLVNSSLAPVLLFRRRLESVADVRRGSTCMGLLRLGGKLC